MWREFRTGHGSSVRSLLTDLFDPLRLALASYDVGLSTLYRSTSYRRRNRRSVTLQERGVRGFDLRCDLLTVDLRLS